MTSSAPQPAAKDQSTTQLQFGTQNLSVEELVAMSLPVENPNDAYEDYRWDGKLIRVYDSQPTTLSDGATISLDSMIIKITDFGLGTYLFEGNNTDR
jgi:hypothetical protein